MAEQKTELPQEGRTICPESLSDLQSDCPKDSGGGIEPLITIGARNLQKWEADPFKRRDSIGRSPPTSRRGSTSSTQSISRRGSISSVISSVASGTADEETKVEGDRERGQKRIRGDEEEEHKKIDELKKMLNKLIDTSKNLKDQIKAIPNTKSEIKKGINDISQQIEVMNRKCHEWETYPRERKVRAVRKQAVSIGIQVEMETTGTKNKEVPEEQQAREEIWKLMEEEKTNNILEEIAWRDWPKLTYRKTYMETGNPVKVAPDWDLAFYMTDNTPKDKGLAKFLNEQYPLLVQAEKPEGECITRYTTASTLTVPGRSVNTNEKHIFKISPEVPPNSKENIRSIYLCLQKIRDMAIAENRQKIAIAFLDYPDIEMAKKVTEYTFFGTRLDVAIYAPYDAATLGTTTKGTQRKNKSQKPNEAIIVKADGRTYADLVRELKTKVDPEKMGVVVKEIRKTRSGDMLLALDGEDATNKLKQQIKKEVVGVTVDNVRKEVKVLHVIDLDAVTSEEEIRGEIVSQFQIPEKEVVVRNVRPTTIGKQIATVVLSSEEAHKILQIGKIKIGWINCRVKERVAIKRCYRCQSYGHGARDCKGPDRGRACYKCGEEGHIASTCKNEDYCPVCNKGGHRTGTLKCPDYRKILSTINKQGKKQTSK